MTRYLQVQNLPRHAVVKDIREFFAGTGLDMHKSKIRMLGGLKGNAFITLQNEEEVMVAQSLSGTRLHKQRLSIFPVSKREMTRITDIMLSNSNSSHFSDRDDIDDRPIKRSSKDNEMNSKERPEKKKKRAMREVISSDRDMDGSLKSLKVTVNNCEEDRDRTNIVIRRTFIPSTSKGHRSNSHGDRSLRDVSFTDMSVNLDQDTEHLRDDYRRSRHREISFSPERTKDFRKDYENISINRERSFSPEPRQRPYSRSRDVDNFNFRNDILEERRPDERDVYYRPRDRSISPKRRWEEEDSSSYSMLGRRKRSFSPTSRQSFDQTHTEEMFRPRNNMRNADVKQFDSADRSPIYKDDRDDRHIHERSWSPRQCESPVIKFNSRERNRTPKDERHDRSLKRQINTSEDEAENDPGYISVHNVPITVTARDLREFFKYPIAKQGIIMKSSDQGLHDLIAYVKFVSLKDAVKCLGTGKLHQCDVYVDLISPEDFEKETPDIPSSNIATPVTDPSYGYCNPMHAFPPPVLSPTFPHPQHYAMITPPEVINYPVYPVQLNPTVTYSHMVPPPVVPPHVVPPHVVPSTNYEGDYSLSENEQQQSEKPALGHVMSEIKYNEFERRPSLPIEFMSMAFATVDNKDKLCHLGLWNIPKGTTACGVWALYGGSNGRSLGVVVGWVPEYMTSGDFRSTAFVTFGNAADCEQAKSTYRSCEEYKAANIDKFFTSIATNPACRVLISTKFREDRILSPDECNRLVTQMDTKKLLKTQLIIEKRHMTNETNCTALTPDLLLRACNIPRAIQKPTPDEAFKKLNSAWKGRIYLLVMYFASDTTTACSIWDDYGGQGGKFGCTGAIFRKGKNAASVAYVGFKNIMKCNEAMSIHKSCRRVSLYNIVAKLSAAPPNETIFLSTWSGFDYKLTDAERNILSEVTLMRDANLQQSNKSIIVYTNNVAKIPHQSIDPLYAAKSVTTPVVSNTKIFTDNTGLVVTPPVISKPYESGLVRIAARPLVATIAKPIIETPTKLLVPLTDTTEQLKPIQPKFNKSLKKIKVNLK